MNFKKACTMAILAVVIIFGSLLFGQILGGYYIYSLLFSDNLSETDISEQQPLPNPEKIMILRLEPITFNTLQIGIYSDGKEAQKVVNDLVQMGIRPYATAKAPYKIWVGCFGEKRTGTPLENQLREQGYEVFLGQGL
ncbi:MAG: SPOR domain-containing protein, partial [Clostridia bacterium]|nr:SPOR domain-containing protein [Clostridia bacterium]